MSKSAYESLFQEKESVNKYCTHAGMNTQGASGGLPIILKDFKSVPCFPWSVGWVEIHVFLQILKLLRFC